MGYTETLFGHQDPILSLSSLSGENCVSVGGRDKTARFWKIAQESQLVFRGGGDGGGTKGTKRNKMREILEGGLGVDDENHEDTDEKSKDQYQEGSLECIAMIDESTFVTGGDSGYVCLFFFPFFFFGKQHSRTHEIKHRSISLWSTQKKKPIFTHRLAHGLHQVQSSTEGLLESPRWITALAALAYSDLFVSGPLTSPLNTDLLLRSLWFLLFSGSWDGQIRLWKLDPKLRSFTALGSVPIPGVINSLQLVSPPSLPSSSSSPPPPPIQNNHVVPSSQTQSKYEQSNSSEQKSSSSSSSSWLHAHSHFRTHTHTHTHTSSPAVLVIVGSGQEHRFGRWLTVKDGGAVNGAYVIALVPSCLSFDDSAVASATAVNGSSRTEKTLRTL